MRNILSSIISYTLAAASGICLLGGVAVLLGGGES